MPCMLMPLPWPAVEVLTLRGQDSPSSWSWRLKPTARFDTSSMVWVFFFSLPAAHGPPCDSEKAEIVHAEQV